MLIWCRWRSSRGTQEAEKRPGRSRRWGSVLANHPLRELSLVEPDPLRQGPGGEADLVPDHEDALDVAEVSLSPVMFQVAHDSTLRSTRGRATQGRSEKSLRERSSSPAAGAVASLSAAKIIEDLNRGSRSQVQGRSRLKLDPPGQNDGDDFAMSTTACLWAAHPQPLEQLRSRPRAVRRVRNRAELFFASTGTCGTSADRPDRATSGIDAAPIIQAASLRVSCALAADLAATVDARGRGLRTSSGPLISGTSSICVPRCPIHTGSEEIDAIGSIAPSGSASLRGSIR